MYKIVSIALLCMLLANGIFAQNRALKVIAYNVWNDYDWGKNNDRRTKVINWLYEQKPDIVAL